jgi:hypothetical protein
MTSSCDCSILPEQGIAWREASETYGIEGTGSPWVHNLVDSAAVVRSCGRIFGSVEDSNRPCGSKHVVGEEDVCHQAAIAASEALRDIYVWLGDEGDHKWQPFRAPRIEGEETHLQGSSDTAIVAVDALRAACGGALFPALGFEATPIEEKISRIEREADDDGDNNANQALAWRSAVAAMVVCEVSHITYFRPVEYSDSDNRGCVFPHFIVGYSPQGSLAGVVGLTVWT